ncbi:tyrosine-type recombinase/integrase [Lactococcus piscium]|nr:tyrosine-type recombinase/integrase [Lactococcus carnosus]
MCLPVLSYLPHQIIHIVRHTHISKLAEIGVPLHIIQRRVGHASEKITREIYLHITNKMKSDTKDLLELL